MRDLKNAAGVQAPTSDYPNGRIVDNQTPITEFVNGDMLQFFQYLARTASITPNGQPDNVSNGYQLITALKGWINTFTTRGVKEGVSAFTMTDVQGGTLNVNENSYIFYSKKTIDSERSLAECFFFGEFDGGANNEFYAKPFDTELFRSEGYVSAVVQKNTSTPINCIVTLTQTTNPNWLKFIVTGLSFASGDTVKVWFNVLKFG